MTHECQLHWSNLPPPQLHVNELFPFLPPWPLAGQVDKMLEGGHKQRDGMPLEVADEGTKSRYFFNDV